MVWLILYHKLPQRSSFLWICVWEKFLYLSGAIQGQREVSEILGWTASGCQKRRQHEDTHTHEERYGMVALWGQWTVCVHMCVCTCFIRAPFQRSLSYTCGLYLSHSAVPLDLALLSWSHILSFLLSFMLCFRWRMAAGVTNIEIMCFLMILTNTILYIFIQSNVHCY